MNRKKTNEQKKYTAELYTTRRLMIAENGGITPENKRRNCLQSLLNQYTKWYPEEFNRFSEGNWKIRKTFKSEYPGKYAEIMVLIEMQVIWTNNLQQNIGHGIISHSAMRDAVKAVMG
jgi:hypothetical protein